MKRVDAADRVGEPVGDRPGDPAGHVAGHQLDLLAALLAQFVEERLHGLAVTAGCRPDQPAAVVADDDGQVALALAMAYLINPDPPEAVEQIDFLLGLGRDSLADLTNRPPRDPHQLGDRGLRRVDRQPRGLVFERRREPRPMARPRHRADHDAVAPATNPRGVGLDEREGRPEIQRSPAPPTLTKIKPRRPAPAHTAAIALPRAGPGRHHELTLAADPHVLDHRPPQAQQPRPYPDPAHVVSASCRFQPSRSRNPRREAACAPLRDLHLTHGNNRSA